MQKLFAFKLENLPDLTGKVAIVTGGNGGIGFEISRMLLGKGAHVIIASRSLDRVAEAVAKLQAAYPTGKVEGMTLQLNSLKRVKEFADAFIAKGLTLHLLVNNAALFIPPFAQTEEGMEAQIGVNHFSTYYLTSLLLPLLKQSAPSRIIYVNSNVSESSHLKVDWDDLKGSKLKVSGSEQYAVSKLYNFMLAKAQAKELQGSGVSVVVVNPGLVYSGVQFKSEGFVAKVFLVLSKVLGQTCQQGALHIVYGAAEPTLVSSTGGFAAITPIHANHMWGPTGPWINQNYLLADDQACERIYEETKKILGQEVALAAAK